MHGPDTGPLMGAATFNEWSRYHDRHPNTEFDHYIANAVRIASNGPSTILEIIEAHVCLCAQAASLLDQVKKGDQDCGFKEIHQYELYPLYSAVLLIVDHFETKYHENFELEAIVLASECVRCIKMS